MVRVVQNGRFYRLYVLLAQRVVFAVGFAELAGISADALALVADASPVSATVVHAVEELAFGRGLGTGAVVALEIVRAGATPFDALALGSTAAYFAVFGRGALVLAVLPFEGEVAQAFAAHAFAAGNVVINEAFNFRGCI